MAGKGTVKEANPYQPGTAVSNRRDKRLGDEKRQAGVPGRRQQRPNPGAALGLLLGGITAAKTSVVQASLNWRTGPRALLASPSRDNIHRARHRRSTRRHFVHGRPCSRDTGSLLR